jgi:hypothetical protein
MRQPLFDQRKPPRPWCPAALAVAGTSRELPKQERKVGEPRPGAVGHQLAAKSMAKLPSQGGPEPHPTTAAAAP